MNENLINCLYSYFKNSAKKLKIICDWDEVIQSHEPYALWLAKREVNEKFNLPFFEYFKEFWGKKSIKIEYSNFGSRFKISGENDDTNLEIKQTEIKNSVNFYQYSPFLTIAKELLLLIKNDKIENLIFLSAYDKRKFPEGDPRKKEIFRQSFGKYSFCFLQLVGFDNEKQGTSKSDWIKKNAFNFDLVIDDNPNILKSIINNKLKLTTFSPYYLNLEKEHEKDVILIKTSVSDLKKEDFKNLN